MKDVKIKATEILSDNWYILRKVTFDLKTDQGWQTQAREVYDRGNGATVLLYNKTSRKVLLTEQFRLPTFLNGNQTGMLIETCAGVVENENPESCIIRETEEETGYRIKDVSKVFEAYMSPGAVTEILHFFVAEYSEEMKISEGGGQASEQENIRVLEKSFDEVQEMLLRGEIKDAKTILLIQYALLNGLIS